MKLTNLVPQDFKCRIQIEVDEILMNTLGVLLIFSALIQVVTVLCLASSCKTEEVQNLRTILVFKYIHCSIY